MLTNTKKNGEPGARALTAGQPEPDRQTTQLGLLARDLHTAMSRAIDERVAGQGLSSNICRYLAIMRKHDGITPKELSDCLGVRSPTTVAALRTLEAKKLVIRLKDVADGRKSPFRLTAKGAEIESEVREAALEVERTALAALSDAEVDALRQLITRMRQALAPTFPDPSFAD